jgi:ATP-dependent Clp protease ATP-binding subunit ClpA/ATP-dependent Clp protease ATP-binding subunit ClpC
VEVAAPDQGGAAVTIDFTIGVYCEARDGVDQWTALVPKHYFTSVVGDSDSKRRERMIDRLRDMLRRAPPVEQELFQLPLGTELQRVPIDVKTKTGRLFGKLPIVVEPRWTSETEQKYFCYHPRFHDLWFVAETRDDIETLSLLLARHLWADLEEDDDDLALRLSTGKDRITTLAFSADPQSLLDTLPSKKKDARAAASAPRPDRVLKDLAVDETQRAANGSVPLGVPRSPYRERLAYLLGGPRPRSVAVVGPPGAGKTALIQRWIDDRLAEDGYSLHRNLDRCAHVWRLTGKRLIAGMSYIGQWEERLLAVLDEARKRRGILWLEDLHLFGRLGQSRQSERSFADFFRGPVRRGDVALVAEMTREQHARLERDAPGLAEALSLVAVPAAEPGETAQLLLHEIRALETHNKIAIHPYVPRAALELGAALFPWRARPGVAIELVRRVAEEGARDAEEEIIPSDVIELLARTTGLSPKLLQLDQALDPGEVEAAFAARVMGQPAATRAATDVVLKLRSGLADPGRPVSVLLFTGPTGTGKTELAIAIAEYLYGDPDRFVRIDMGEMSGPDAVARLIGDRWQPEGLLTSRVRAQPFCVVLLDEIEKAHPRALHLLLQLFDEGRLTDASGEVASFASAVVIMTSNLGARHAQPIGFGETRDRILADVARAVRDFFPVELFNRIDQVVPFEPLTLEVAAKVVDKELGKLLARRGLRERNTFVYAGAAVRKRAVVDAFDPRYGARTVKRWLEDHVAGSLTDLLATAPPARLRIIRLADDAGTIRASLEPMAEKRRVSGSYVLEGALDLATAGLEPAIEDAVAALQRIRATHAIERGRREATGEVRYYIDELDQRLAALAQLFGTKYEREPDDDHESAYEHRLLRDAGGDHREVRLRMRRPARRRVPASRDALTGGIAETLLIERALPQLLEPDAHAVTIVLSRIGSAASNGLTAVMQVYALYKAWIDSASHANDAGEIVDLPLGGKPSGTFADWLSFWKTRRDIVLCMRGLFVREALADDHGTWLLRAAAAEPDVVRVEIRAGAARSPREVLVAHLAARRDLERVLDEGGALPPNPDTLLPVTRTITSRAPLWWSQRPFEIELEDFSTGWIDRGLRKDVPSQVRRAWHLAWSRQR